MITRRTLIKHAAWSTMLLSPLSFYSRHSHGAAQNVGALIALINAFAGRNGGQAFSALNLQLEQIKENQEVIINGLIELNASIVDLKNDFRNIFEVVFDSVFNDVVNIDDELL